MASALNIVQAAFPNVTKVVDAKKDSVVEVTKRDTTSATVRNHKACAMAVACKRKMDLDGVIMSISTAYLVKGNVATRYLVPQSVAREITAFDRNAVFEPGEYRLKAAGESAKLNGVRGPYPQKSGKSKRQISPRGSSTRPKESELRWEARVWCSDGRSHYQRVRGRRVR